MRNIFPVILGLVMLAACSEGKKSDKVDPGTIYQKHKVRYTGGILYLESEFHTDAAWDRLETEKFGEHVELIAPAAILFNGQPMTKDNSVFTGPMYTLKQNELPEQLTWEWTDNKGTKYVNTVKMNPIRIKEPELNGNMDLIIRWEGLPVQENEEVLVTVEGDVNGKEESSTKSESALNADSVTFSREFMKQFHKEAIAIRISRVSRIPVARGTAAGGHILLDYDGGFKTTSGIYIFKDRWLDQ